MLENKLILKGIVVLVRFFNFSRHRVWEEEETGIRDGIAIQPKFKEGTPEMETRSRSTLAILTLAVTLLGVDPSKAGESLAAEGEEVAQLIAEYFPDNYSTMVAIASCESTGLVHKLDDGKLIPNADGGSARGVFQVLMRIHGPEMKRLGLDPNNDDDYMTYVRHLYDESGLAPWKASKKCWKNKKRKYKKPTAIAMS